MIPPPDALGRVESASTTAARRRQTKRARRHARRDRRAYLLQCGACGEKATGELDGRGVLVSHGMRINYRRHVDCGGEIGLFDIRESEDD